MGDDDDRRRPDQPKRSRIKRHPRIRGTEGSSSGDPADRDVSPEWIKPGEGVPAQGLVPVDTPVRIMICGTLASMPECRDFCVFANVAMADQVFVVDGERRVLSDAVYAPNC